jgi:hypothetical protein
MPSANAANWFAATMVAFLFYRRSARFFLPVALAVSYSRIYNAAHFPSDVLVGAILGAGYGVAMPIGFNAFWRWAGRRWLPLWWERLPSLVPLSAEAGSGSGDSSPSAIGHRPSAIETHWLRLGYVLIAVLLLARWAYLASGIIELSEDEAYQWLWSKHLALSYYSKPPMIAYAQFLGTSICGDTVLGVRFLSPVLAAILGFLLLRFFAREVSARTGFFLLLILLATPLVAVGSTMLTVDPLSVFFWTLAMLAGWRAIRDDATIRDWLWVGLWTGLGLLSKYTALLQWISWAVLFALWPPARKQLRRPGPYLALLICLLCAVPVLVWNAQHDWITLKHVAADNAKLGEPWHFTLRHFFEFLGGELGLLNPVFFVAIWVAAIGFWCQHAKDLRMVFFFSMGAPLFVIYLLFSFHSKVQLNWIAPAIVPLLCLMTVCGEANLRRGARYVLRWLVLGLVLGLALVTVLHDTNLIAKATGKPLPMKLDPLRRVRGWTEVARVVGEARERLLAEGKPVFIIGSHYGLTSQIAFNLPEARERAGTDPLVFYRTSDRPVNQFYFWPDSRGRKGESAIYVSEGSRPKPPPETVLAEFASVRPLELREVLYRGRVITTLQLFECRGLR